MSIRTAIAFVETRGLVGAIEAADAAVKAADVELLGYQEVGDGLVSVRFCGDVAAAQAAVVTAVEAARRVGTVVHHSVIPAPHEQVGAWLRTPPQRPSSPGDIAGPGKGPEPRARRPGPRRGIPTQGVPAQEAAGETDSLAQLSVSRLRAMVRGIPEATLKGREVSRASKATLLAELRRLRGEASPRQ